TGGPLTVAALEGGQVDVAVMFTTDAAIASKGLVLLDDDKHLQLAVNVAPVVRDDYLSKAGADFKTLLSGVSAKLTTQGQADLTVHGGPNKAVYIYPSEHYAYWGTELPGRALGWGMLGENLTTEGLLETAVHVGDRFRVGSAEVVVTQPRMPCYKLGIKLG